MFIVGKDLHAFTRVHLPDTHSFFVGRESRKKAVSQRTYTVQVPSVPRQDTNALAAVDLPNTCGSVP